MLIMQTIAKVRRAYFLQKEPIKAVCREFRRDKAAAPRCRRRASLAVVMLDDEHPRTTSVFIRIAIFQALRCFRKILIFGRSAATEPAPLAPINISCELVGEPPTCLLSRSGGAMLYLQRTDVLQART